METFIRKEKPNGHGKNNVWLYEKDNFYLPDLFLKSERHQF